jgi:hypothetical protein
MALDYDFDIPELQAIDLMMDDLIPQNNGEVNEDGENGAEGDNAGFDGNNRASAKKQSKTNRRSQVSIKLNRKPKRARFKRFTAHTLGQFNEGSNWTNALNFRSKLTGSAAGVHTRIGAVSLKKFSESFNWKNAHDGPQLVLASGPSTPDSGPPETVDGFFEAMIWE